MRIRSRCRVGNAASEQMQLDVYGELADALLHAYLGGIRSTQEDVGLQTALDRTPGDRFGITPDSGIWEIRGEPQHFTYSKVMAWVAFDRVIKSLEKSVEPAALQAGPRFAIRSIAMSAKRAYNQKLSSFTQTYGSDAIRRIAAADPASRLLALGRSTRDRHCGRYRKAPDGRTDLCCVIEPKHRRRPAARAKEFSGVQFLDGERAKDDGPGRRGSQLFDRLLSLTNDVGLLAEEYDPRKQAAGRQFPAGAFAHRTDQCRV